MSAATTLAPPTARWDLTSLFSGPDDPRVPAAWSDLARRADEFAERYRGKIEAPDLTAHTLAEAIEELEWIAAEAAKPMNFAELLFAADASDPKLGAFLQAQREQATGLQVKLIFFELELMSANSGLIGSLLEDRRLENYRHYVGVVRKHSPHRLSEPEEIVLEETANTGVRAWVRLFDEVTSNHVFDYLDPRSGESSGLSQEEVLNLLRDPDRRVREAAADSFTSGLESLKRVLTFTFNTLLQDKSVGDRLRKHPYPEHSRHLANELDKATVDLVVRLCIQNYRLVERFYKVKRQILGLEELTHIDRYAPLFEASEEIGYEEAQSIVLEAFGAFSPELKQRADEFFRSDWIDAEPRPGKTGGAFCSYNTPDTHPVVLMSYLNKMNDVMTLAHELGHGAHASLSREQSYFNFHGTLPLAELASTFGEMLVFEKVVAKASPKDKLALYAEKIEGVFATVFRQAAMYGFEQRCHQARRSQGELSAEQIGEVWQVQLQEMFGKSVRLGEQHKLWWSYVSHFVAVPFYVYAYSFGELLVLSLYQMAKAEGPAFEAKYVELLRLGGSRSPQELMDTVGVDLGSEEFWQGGFRAMESLVAEFERLWADYSARA